MHRKIIFSVTIIIGLMLTACGGAETTSTPGTGTPAIDAEALYRTTCVVCHGPDREGIAGLGKPLTPDALSGYSASEVRGFIADGKSDTAMRAFSNSLSGDEIDALAQFIKNVAP